MAGGAPGIGARRILAGRGSGLVFCVPPPKPFLHAEVFRKAVQLCLVALGASPRRLKVGLVEPRNETLQTGIIGL